MYVTDPVGNIRQCKKCEEYFGTATVWFAHEGERGCKTHRVLLREGFWQGHSDIWWSTDLGWDDTIEDWWGWKEDGEPLEDDPKLLPILNT
jgi:hypothetical protein